MAQPPLPCWSHSWALRLKRKLHTAFWKRKRDKLLAVFALLCAIAPIGAPHEVAAWCAQQLPGVPFWVPTALGWSIFFGRLLLVKEKR